MLKCRLAALAFVLTVPGAAHADWKPKHREISFGDLGELATTKRTGTLSLVGRRFALELPSIYKPGELGDYRHVLPERNDGCDDERFCTHFWHAESQFLPAVIIQVRRPLSSKDGWTCNGPKTDCSLTTVVTGKYSIMKVEVRRYIAIDEEHSILCSASWSGPNREYQATGTRWLERTCRRLTVDRATPSSTRR